MTRSTAEPDLEKQYERVLEEYRFQVQLNWDRTKHYLTFNTVLFGAAVALSKDASTWTSYAGVSVLLWIAALNSYFGQSAVQVGHEYYRGVRTTKTALEKRLQLEAFAIVSTPGMMRDHDAAPAGTPAAGSRRPKSITNQARVLLGLIGICAFIGAVFAGYTAIVEYQHPLASGAGNTEQSG